MEFSERRDLKINQGSAAGDCLLDSINTVFCRLFHQPGDLVKHQQLGCLLSTHSLVKMNERFTVHNPLPLLFPTPEISSRPLTFRHPSLFLCLGPPLLGSVCDYLPINMTSRDLLTPLIKCVRCGLFSLLAWNTIITLCVLLMKAQTK